MHKQFRHDISDVLLILPINGGLVKSAFRNQAAFVGVFLVAGSAQSGVIWHRLLGVEQQTGFESVLCLTSKTGFSQMPWFFPTHC